MESDEPVIGIDLGTTNSCVAILKNDNAEIVHSKVGNELLPSRVFFDEYFNIIVGNGRSKFADKIVYNVKRFIGKKYSEIPEKGMKNWSFKIEKSSEGDIPEVVIKNDKEERRYTATEISSFILKELKDQADKELNKSKETKTNAVITVPAYFKEKQREETKKAAEMANLNVIQLINEPTAAAFEYCNHLDKLNDKSYSNLLIYDFGGGTFDVSVIQVNHKERTITVKKTDGDSNLGGEDIDNLLLEEYGIKEYKCKMGKDPKNNVILKMKERCEIAKRRLSSDDEIELELNDIPGIDENVYISRNDFKALTKNLLNKTFDIVKSVVNDVDGGIDYIVLVGGSSKIPFIHEELKEMFPSSEIKVDINSETVVAKGATLYANGKVLSGYKCVDIISHTLSTDLADGKSQKLFPKNSAIPATKIMYYRNANNTGVCHIGIYEGEDEDYKKNRYLGGCNIPISAGEPGTVTLKVFYAIDYSGIIEITAEEVNPNPHEVKEKIRLSEECMKQYEKLDIK